MSSQYSCDIIRDLLPGYIDHVISQTGNDAVKEHLTECRQCNDIYVKMSEALDGMNKITSVEQDAVDGLKKIKKHTQYLKIAIAFVSGLLGTLLLVYFLTFHVFGRIQPPSQITATECLYNEETQSLMIKGTLRSSMRVSRVEWHENKTFADRIDVSVYAAELLPFQKEQRNFSITIPDVKGWKVYFVGEDYEQSEAYSWKTSHVDLLIRLEEKIFNCFPPEWNRDNVYIHYSSGIKTLNGTDGILYDVDFLVGDEDAYYWTINDTVVLYGGDFEPADFTVWISLEEPHQVLIYDRKTGTYTDDYSILNSKHPAKQ